MGHTRHISYITHVIMYQMNHMASHHISNHIKLCISYHIVYHISFNYYATMGPCHSHGPITPHHNQNHHRLCYPGHGRSCSHKLNTWRASCHVTCALNLFFFQWSAWNRHRKRCFMIRSGFFGGADQGIWSKWPGGWVSAKVSRIQTPLCPSPKTASATPRAARPLRHLWTLQNSSRLWWLSNLWTKATKKLNDLNVLVR